MTHILILGGTAEAATLARHLAERPEIPVTLSLAGRTLNPRPQPVPTRIGGFGGVDGLTGWLIANRTSLVVDATHPFAARISANAVAACQAAKVQLLGLEREKWQPAPTDHWTEVPDLASAVAALPETPATLFLGLGRQSLKAFESRPEHHYIARVIDPPDEDIALPHFELIEGRGPFTAAEDEALFRRHGVSCILAKNAGGPATYSKILAARMLGLPVIMINRPFIPPRPLVRTPEEALATIVSHWAAMKRGV